MAKSKAKKLREHLERNTGRNPEAFRGDAGVISTHVRKTPTRSEKLARSENKHKSRMLHYA